MIFSSFIFKDIFEFEKKLVEGINEILQLPFADHKKAIDDIDKMLDEAYRNNTRYDLMNFKNRLIAFVNHPTNKNISYCLKKINTMHLLGKPNELDIESHGPIRTVEHEDSGEIIFFDVEVFSNLFVVCYKFIKDKKVRSLINPTPEQIENMFKYRLIGFNNRRYDNHILWARMMGYSNEHHKQSRWFVRRGL